MKIGIFKKFILYFLIFFIISCKPLEDLSSSLYELKENIFERIKVNLSKVPLIKKYITLYPAPERLYKETEELIIQLELYRAKDLFQDKYKEVIKSWEKAKKLYSKKYYKSAERELNKVNHLAKNLLEEVKNYQENLKNSALKRYERMEKMAQEKLESINSEKKRLEIKLYLLKLKKLIEMENYEEFEKELQNPPF